MEIEEHATGKKKVRGRSRGRKRSKSAGKKASPRKRIGGNDHPLEVKENLTQSPHNGGCSSGFVSLFDGPRPSLGDSGAAPHITTDDYEEATTPSPRNMEVRLSPKPDIYRDLGQESKGEAPPETEARIVSAPEEVASFEGAKVIATEAFSSRKDSGHAYGSQSSRLSEDERLSERISTSNRKFERTISKHIKPTLAESVVLQAQQGHFNEADQTKVAYVMVDHLAAHSLYHHDMKKNYSALFKFLMYVALILLIVVWQAQFFTSGAVAYKAMRDTLFGLHADVVSTESEVNDRVSDFSTFIKYINGTIVPTVFQDPVCGDDYCAGPEEYPKFVAAYDARSFQGSCKADCGDIPVTEVTVDFFDVWKLKKALNIVNAALESGFAGVTARRWGVVDTSGDILRKPMAGWNICSKTDYEQGYFTPVCIFDAELVDGNPLIIEGLPYRATELDDSNTAFGGSKSVDLYGGEWELRIAFTNFTWPHYETGIETPIAFPAVRGQICINGTCEIFSPCPDSIDTCRCEFFKGDYLCYEADTLYPEWNNFQADYADYPDTLGTDFSGQLMIKNYQAFSAFETNLSASFGSRDDDAWTFMDPSSCLASYVLTLGDTYGDGWNGAEYTIARVSDGVIIAQGTQDSDDPTMTFDAFGNGWYWSTLEVLLCQEEEAYVFTISAGSWPAEARWGLYDKSDAFVFSGTGDIFSSDDIVGDSYSCIFYGTSTEMESCTDVLGLGDSSSTAESRRGLLFGAATPSGRNKKNRAPRRKLLDEYDDDDYNDDDASSSCSVSYQADGYCDSGNNKAECDYDSGDCCEESCVDTPEYTCGVNGFFCVDPAYTSCTGQLGNLKDGWCDSSTNTEECFYDGGDCCVQTCVDSTYGCGSNGYDCQDVAVTPYPTHKPTHMPTMHPTVSVAPTRSPTEISELANGWNLPHSALLRCDSVSSDDSAAKCSQLEYEWQIQTCSVGLLGDGRCDAINNHLGCGWDLGDCCEDTCTDNQYVCADQFTDTWDSCYIPTIDVDSDDEESWPYYIELLSDVTATYPHSFAASVMDIVTVQQNFEFNSSTNRIQQVQDSLSIADDGYIPSSACGDCSTYDGAYQSVPFTVTVEEESVYHMFPALEDGTSRERYFSSPNRVLGGILLTQLRLRSHDCPNPPFNDENDDENCMNFPGDATYYDYVDEAYKETSAFGSDPTFVDTSSSYRATNTKDVLDELYSDDEVNNNGIPYGFFADSGAGAWQEIVKAGCDDIQKLWFLNPLDPQDATNCMRYPVLYDINFNTSRAFDITTLLVEGNYLDESTGFVAAQLATYNVVTKTFYYIQVSSQRMPSGEFRFQWLIEDVIAELYTSTSDTIRFGFEILFLFCIFSLLGIEVVEWRSIKKRTKSNLAYFMDLGNLVDLANYIIVLACVAVHIIYHFQAKKMLGKARYHFDVYRDYDATGRILQMHRPGAIKMTRFFRSLNNLAGVRDLYNTLIAIYLILVCIQLIKNLAFHPYLGVVSHTLKHAKNDLAFFLVLLVTVNVIYAFLGTVLFGSTVDSFATFIVSLSTSVTILSGVYSPLEDTGTTPIALVYFWSNTLLNYFLLFNFLLAIIVDAYQKAKADTEANPLYNFNHDPFFEMFRNLIGFPVGGRCNLPDRELLHALLEASKGLSRKLMHHQNKDLSTSNTSSTKAADPVPTHHTSPFVALHSSSRNSHVRRISVQLKQRELLPEVAPEDGGFLNSKHLNARMWKYALEHADEADSLRFFIFPRAFRGQKKSSVAVNQRLIEVALRTGLLRNESKITEEENKAIKVLAFNFIERFGYDADKNHDGFLDEDELDALRTLLKIELQSAESEVLVHAFVGHTNAKWIETSGDDDE